ncbi:DUF4239 domain-containing protein [Microbacterium sp. DT81.1]|uniref:bestrophin-like domain n=1 Tax=Microbacterium sp. DT81.1 TaxID=3393413 RepID=UPI003CE86805
MIGTFGVFFGILLALVAVSVYENYSATRQAALHEAGQLTAFYRGTTGLPEDVASPIQQTIDEYLVVVIEQDWPDQRRGSLPDASVELVDEMERQIHEYKPADLQQLAEFQQLLATFDDFVETRRERIDATTLELPGLFWLAIWVGAAVNAVLIGLIIVKSRRLHLLMAGMLALFIGLVMFTTADMDRPYQGFDLRRPRGVRTRDGTDRGHANRALTRTPDLTETPSASGVPSTSPRRFERA